MNAPMVDWRVLAVCCMLLGARKVTRGRNAGAPKPRLPGRHRRGTRWPVRLHQHLIDAVSIRIHHCKAEPVPRNMFSRDANPPETPQDKARQGLMLGMRPAGH